MSNVEVEFVGGRHCGDVDRVMRIDRALPKMLRDRYMQAPGKRSQAGRPVYEWQPPVTGQPNPSTCTCGMRGCPNYGKAGK